MLVLTPTETLLGGCVVVISTFDAGRKLGLSNYWRSILSIALPFLGYLGYSIVIWPGWNWMAIHFAVFTATAVVVGVFAAMRKKMEKIHWFPKVIAIFFVGLVIVNVALMTVSSEGLPDKFVSWFLPHQDQDKLNTAFPGVVPHDRNTLYESHMQRIEQQRSLGWDLDIEGLDTLQRQRAGKVSVEIHDAGGKPVAVEKVILALWRIANSGDDRHVQLASVREGRYEGELRLPEQGRWVVEVTATRGQDVFVKQQPFFVDDSAKK
jgi:nitrogen fixation protein FixH